MNLILSLLAALMVGDALFTLANQSKVEGLLKEHFPNLDLRKLALVEGLAGGLILAMKAATHSII